jgi:hypothetical protein
MLSAAQRQRKLAKRAKVRKEMARIAKLELITGDYRRSDDTLLIIDKREELFGQGDLYDGYTAEQIKEVEDIVKRYTPEQREVAIELAKALRWEAPEDDLEVDYSDIRHQQRREQGRGV